ncbi:MAG: monovalent cation/H+ antiporter subunit D [Hyphomicrobiales bacterium]|nr:MAG: monovalent cation/H+ antiporter subunit D [Hyphomicrobiales bacterium]
MEGLLQHLAILPIVLPLLAGVLLVLFDDRTVKLYISVTATVILLVVAVTLLVRTNEGAQHFSMYKLGDWPSPFGIVLVADRLSALMVVLTSVLALTSLVYSTALWHRAGQHFHTLFQLLLMGLNGAFLTGDLFNLFVFFEVLLAASYGLALHGSGNERVRAGLQYIAVNLATSSLFLIGVSLIYGVTGTLNMADLAVRIPLVPDSSRMLLEAGAAILGVAFLVKAGMWPLSFWLPTTYAAATPPVGAMFAIMSKVGVYVILRLSLLLFGDGAASSAHFGSQWLIYGGMATIAFGMVGVLASQGLARMAGFSVLVSSGTLLVMIGYENARVTAGALYYLVSSTLALSCLYLLVELVERGRNAAAGVLALTLEAFGDDEDPVHEEEIGIATPRTLAMLGMAFAACALVLAGMPPLSGFLAKFTMISALFNQDGLGAGGTISAGSWVVASLLVISGLATTIALVRSGINIFWVTFDGEVPRVRVVEMAPVLLLLGLCVLLTVLAGAAMTYMDATAQYLHQPSEYVAGVLGPAVQGGKP